MTPEQIFALAPEWLAWHAPVFTVLLPLLFAPLISIIPSNRLAWGLSVLVTGVVALIAIWLEVAVALHGTISYALGGWAPPFGIEFRIDALNSGFILLIGIIGFLAVTFAKPAVDKEILKAKRPLFYAAFLMVFAGLLGVASTGDAFNMFVFLEISSIPTYVLIALGAAKDRRALPAAFNYLIMGTIGATFYVIGVGFLYAATGSLNMADIAMLLRENGLDRTVEAGFAFIVVGLMLKIAVFPLHLWLPNAYSYAPSLVTVFLSATATKVAFYALVRYLYTVFDPIMPIEIAFLNWVLAPAAAIAALVCSFQAIFQADVRRMLAYSSVAQVGYMTLGLGMGTLIGLSAGLFHLFNHAVIKGALFMAVAIVAMQRGGTSLRHFEGTARQAPWTLAGFAIGGAGLIGVPLTAGFMSKWQLIAAALDTGWWWAAFLIAASSLLAVLYIGRVLQAAYFRPAPEGLPPMREAPLLMLIPLYVLALANIWFGVDTTVPFGLAKAGAEAAFMLGSSQ
jgi:multicomponent Na+:H+ antiporter subunit D